MSRDKKIFSFIKRLFHHSSSDLEPVQLEEQTMTNQPVIFPRSEHSISRSQISSHALKVLYRLKKAGFEAYLVGGCVRDLLLGREPKDFDVVTNARPEQVKKVFRNCRLIGRRFRLAHVHFGRDIIEVATFRGNDSEENGNQVIHNDGRLLRDNVFGNIEEDVWRRDFTVNALYYNINDFSVVDYVNGMADHQAGILRLIGHPEERYREDPVRMLRVVRFAVKLGFIESATEKPLFEMAHLLESIPSARLYDESLKLFLSGKGLQTFELLRHYGLFAPLFPLTEECLASELDDFPRLFVAKALSNSDQRIAEGKSVTPYFLFSTFLWETIQNRATQNMKEGDTESYAYQNAINDVLSYQVRFIALPKRITQSMREVFLLQLRFNKRSGVRPFRLIEHPRFRAAYDFLLLRAESGGADQGLADWWTRFQDADEDVRKKMVRTPKRRTRKKTPTKKTVDSKNNE
jgi:poly(A) polymerase